MAALYPNRARPPRARFARVSLPGRLVDTPSGRLFVHRTGEGPPLVLVHGYLVSHFYFKPVIADLAKRFDVIALDLPAHGESDRTPPGSFKYDLASHADAVAQAMEALGVARAHVWGHSMGGGVAVHLAAQHPSRVDRLVIESATLYPLPLDVKVRLTLTPGIGPFLFQRVFGKPRFHQNFFQAQGG